MDKNLLEYNLPINAYATFDAVTLKNLIKERLTQNSLFTDQNFEGSNLAALADIFAFAYHILLFYYNQTASEALFDQAELYENMNKIVKAIGYKPSGPRTSALSFEATGTGDLPIGAYTIKRYSYIIVNGVVFSFSEDVSFDKTVTTSEVLETLSDNTLLYQGRYFEYPDYTAIGEEYEVITIVDDRVDTSVTEFIDADHIDVYVYESSSQKWYQWSEVDSIYLRKSSDRVFEKRVNENGRYEIKFGDNINGKKLNAGDIVSIFYLLSNGATVGANTLQSSTNINIYNTSRFRELANSLYVDNNTTFVGPNNSSFITLTNPNNSTAISDYETVSHIRSNAPALFAAQKRAVTLEDYKAFLSSKFSNIIQSTQVVNNDTYLSEYVRYYYEDLGLNNPNDNKDVLTSHFLFADACNFNNIYIFAVSKLGSILNETDPSPMPVSQKRAIKNYLDTVRMASNEIVVVDPVYTAFDLGVDIANSTRTIDQIRENVTLELKIDSTSRLARSKIRDIANNIIVNYFMLSNLELGQEVNFANLTRDLLDIETVVEIATVYSAGEQTYKIPGISMVYWNPFYDQADVKITNQTIKLPFYKFPYLYESSNFINKIVITG